MKPTDNGSILLFLEETFSKIQHSQQSSKALEKALERVSDSLLLLDSKEDRKVFFGELCSFLRRRGESIEQTQHLNVGFVSQDESSLVLKMSKKLKSRYSHYIDT